MRRAEPEALLDASPDRVAPPCPHFPACGGCALQHWAAAPYAEWKRARLADALARAGYAGVAVEAVRSTPPRARRRADLGVRRTATGVTLGFHGRGGGALVDLHACEVLHPRLVALFDPLRALLRGLPALRREGSAVLNLLDTGPDLLLRTDGALDATGRAKLAAFAAEHGVPRVAWAPSGGDAPAEVAAQHGPAAIRFGGVEVHPPPGAFLQASPAGEAAIREAVLDALPARLPARAADRGTPRGDRHLELRPGGAARASSPTKCRRRRSAPWPRRLDGRARGSRRCGATSFGSRSCRRS